MFHSSSWLCLNFQLNLSEQVNKQPKKFDLSLEKTFRLDELRQKFLWIGAGPQKNVCCTLGILNPFHMASFL